MSAIPARPAATTPDELRVEGGTDEIQRNTLGERALGLPREPGSDRDTQFRDLARN